MAYLYPVEFRELLKRESYETKNRALVVCLISNQEGVLCATPPDMDKLKAPRHSATPGYGGPGRNRKDCRSDEYSRMGVPGA